ncbi:MAG: hypothetical protein ABFD23_07810 [Caldisericales bacterium]|nr:hypothetical protein [bacterium]
MTKQLKLMTMVVIILMCIPFIWESRGCRGLRRLILPESYMLYNSGNGIGVKYYMGYCVNESSIFSVTGPEDGEMYKDSVLPRSVKVKITSKIDLPGRITSFDTYLNGDYQSTDLYFIYQNGPKCHFASIEESSEYGLRLLKTSEIGGPYLLTITNDYKRFYVQSENLKEIYVYHINGGLIKKYDLQKPSIITLIDNDDQERPIFAVFDGQKLFTFKEGETDEVLRFGTTSNISNAFFFTETGYSIPFWPSGSYARRLGNTVFDLTFNLVLYDGQYLYAINLDSKNLIFKTKVDGLKLGALTKNYIVAPYNEGICLIDNGTGGIKNLLKSSEKFRLLDYGGSMDETLSDMFFTSYSKGKSTIKGWRFGNQKDQIKTISFPSVNDKINHMRKYGYLIFYGDNGIYYTTEMYPSWNDVYW